MKRYRQLSLPFEPATIDTVIDDQTGLNGNGDNSILPGDEYIHRWYRFVLSFPPHLVRHYINLFGLDGDAIILDPFCGTGTTLVEAKLHGIKGIGLETNPFPCFASRVKTDWDVHPDELRLFAKMVAERTYSELTKQGIDDRSLTPPLLTNLRILDEQSMRLLIKNSISPLPLHKTLVLLDQINLYQNTPAHKYGILALGNALVTSIGNLRFGPEVGVGKIKRDVSVVATWLQEMEKIANDLGMVYGGVYPETEVFQADARQLSKVVTQNSVDAVITSPPYPNEKDYTRTTRLESVVLGFIRNRAQLREYKTTFLRSNTRGVYKSDKDDEWVEGIEEIERLASAIEARRIALGKTSGFERLYHRVVKLYFGGMARHLRELQDVLKPGAQLAYVVGDQASYLRVMIRTGQILANIAERQGYQVQQIDLFRTRFATATQSTLREEVVILRWPGNKRRKIS